MFLFYFRFFGRDCVLGRPPALAIRKSTTARDSDPSSFNMRKFYSCFTDSELPVQTFLEKFNNKDPSRISRNRPENIWRTESKVRGGRKQTPASRQTWRVEAEKRCSCRINIFISPLALVKSLVSGNLLWSISSLRVEKGLIPDLQYLHSPLLRV